MPTSLVCFADQRTKSIWKFCLERHRNTIRLFYLCSPGRLSCGKQFCWKVVSIFKSFISSMIKLWNVMPTTLFPWGCSHLLKVKPENSLPHQLLPTLCSETRTPPPPRAPSVLQLLREPRCCSALSSRKCLLQPTRLKDKYRHTSQMHRHAVCAFYFRKHLAIESD